jgi:hypothetical protein
MTATVNIVFESLVWSSYWAFGGSNQDQDRLPLAATSYITGQDQLCPATNLHTLQTLYYMYIKSSLCGQRATMFHPSSPLLSSSFICICCHIAISNVALASSRSLL